MKTKKDKERERKKFERVGVRCLREKNKKDKKKGHYVVS